MDTLADGFGGLANLEEDRLPGGARIPRRTGHGAEVITYVHEGSLTYRDATGLSGVLQAGEFQRTTLGPIDGHGQKNASRTDTAHLFQMILRPTGTEPDRGDAQERFSAGQRRGRLCIVASADARRGSLRIQRNMFVYSALLDPGQHVVHELAQGRMAWVHVVQGELTLGDIVLGTGDGVGITTRRAVSVTAVTESEILLLDL